MTEAEVATLLRRRYGRRYTGNGNNPRYVMAAHVRAQLWEAQQIDFLAIDCSEFRNNVIHGHEIKRSRSDWLRELKQPRKCEAFREVCDYWWLVVSDRSIVRNLDELPLGWGLLYVRGAQLIKALDARANMEVRPMPRGMVASFVRRATNQTLEQEKGVNDMVIIGMQSYLFWSGVIVLAFAALAAFLLGAVPNEDLARWLGDK